MAGLLRFLLLLLSVVAVRGRAARGRGTTTSKPELEGNRIVLNATKQAPAPQASKISGAPAKTRNYDKMTRQWQMQKAILCWVVLRAGGQGRRVFLPMAARASSSSAVGVGPEGRCQAVGNQAGHPFCVLLLLLNSLLLLQVLTLLPFAVICRGPDGSN